MTEPGSNGSKKQIWITVAIVFIQGLLQWGITWGTTSATLQGHAQQLEEMKAHILLIEKRQEENLLSRNEYDKRHQDMQDDLRELRRQVVELERKVR